MRHRHLGMLLANLVGCATSVVAPPADSGPTGLPDTGDSDASRMLPDTSDTADTAADDTADTAFAADSDTGATGFRWPGTGLPGPWGTGGTGRPGWPLPNPGGSAHTGLAPCPGVDPYEVSPFGPGPRPVFGRPFLTGVQQAGDHFQTTGAFLDGPDADADRYQVTIPPGCTLEVATSQGGWPTHLHLQVDAPVGMRHRDDGPTASLSVHNPARVAHTTDVLVGYEELNLPYGATPWCQDYELTLDVVCPPPDTAADTGTDTAAHDTATPTGTPDAVWLYQLPNLATPAVGGRPGLDALARQHLPGRLRNRPSRRWRARGFVSTPGDALVDLPTTSGLPTGVPVFAVDEGGEATRLGVDWADLFDGGWESSLEEPLELLTFFERGFRTGTASDGSATGEDCDGWSSTSGAHASTLGSTTSTAALGPFPTPTELDCSPVVSTQFWGTPSPVMLGVAWCIDGCDAPPDPTCPIDLREADDAGGGTSIVVGVGQTVVVEGVLVGTETDTVAMTPTDPSCWMRLDVEGDDRMLHGAVVHQDLAVMPQSNGLVSGTVGFDIRGVPAGSVPTLTLTGTDPDVCLPWTATYTQTWCP